MYVKAIAVVSLLSSHIVAGPSLAATSPVKHVIAKGSMSGHIYDAATGQPLAGASLYFPDLKTGVVADATGAYSIKNIPSGNHTLEISRVGFASMIEIIQVDGNVIRDFSLKTTAVENDAIVITGGSSASSLRRTPTPMNIVKKEELLRMPYTNIIDAIAKQPGVSELSTGPAISKPVIRGLGYNRIITVNDGVRQEGQQWGDEHGIEIDDYNVSRIEILKGPTSLMYGSDGLAGVVNIISTVPVPEGTIRGNINSNYQTNNGLYALNGNLAGNVSGFNWNVYGTLEAAHDYKNKYDGYVFNSKYQNANYGGYVGLNKSWGYSHLQYSLFNQKLGLMEGDRDDQGRFTKITGTDGIGNDVTAPATDHDFKSYDPFIGYQRIIHEKVTLDNNFYLGKSRLAVTLGWQKNRRREYGDIDAPLTPGLSLQLNTYTYDIKYSLPDEGKWQTAFGINGMQQKNETLGSEALVPAYSLFDIGGFAFTKRNFDKLTLSGGIRYDHRTLNSRSLLLDGENKFAAFDRNFENVSASVGATYALSNKVTAKLNVSRAFRAPNIAELAANGVHEGTIKYDFGNQDLKPETSLQFDAGVDVHTEHVSVTASLFYNHINNYIYSRKLESAGGGDSIPAADNSEGYAAYKYFQTDANLYGGELSVDIHPHPLDWLHFENTISYVRATSGFNTDSTRNLPNIPPMRWLCELRGDFPKATKWLHHSYAKVEMDLNAAQTDIFSAYQTETATSGYTLLNAGIGGDIVNRKQQKLFSIFIAANNIADVAYQSHLSRLKYAPENVLTGRMGVFNMGRNFSFKVTIPLDFNIK